MCVIVQCNSPAPSCGGQGCAGGSTVACNTQSCPSTRMLVHVLLIVDRGITRLCAAVNGGYGPWSSCSVGCVIAGVYVHTYIHLSLVCSLCAHKAPLWSARSSATAQT